MQTEKEKFVSDKWVMIMDVIFAGIVVFGLQNFVTYLINLDKVNTLTLSVSIWAVIAVYAFLLYDVVVYHLLVQDFPYQLSALGALRFILDVVMAFMLMIVVIPTSMSSESAVTYMLLGALLWHVSAIFWHIIANSEYSRTPRLKHEKMRTHYIAIAAYIIVPFFILAFREDSISLDNLKDPLSLVVISSLLILISIYRSVEVIHDLKKSPT